MKIVTLMLMSILLMSCESKPKKKKIIHREETTEQVIVVPEKDGTYVATEHNTFVCAVDVAGQIYTSTSEDGSVLIFKNNVATITDPTDDEVWTMFNPTCLFVKRQ